MKINKKVEMLTGCKVAIDSLNTDRGQLLKILDVIVPLMKSAKLNLKNLQVMYWNNKSIRTDTDFIKSYESADETYKLCKLRYESICDLLKLNKLTIKARQRDISKLNKS